jgi:hypothetical protein
VEQRAARSAAEQREAVLLRKASRLGQLQGVNAAVAIILLASWVHVPAWLSGSLIAAVIAISYGMHLRSQWAFRAILVLNTAGSLVFAGVSISHFSDARLFFLLFPVVFAWWLGFLTWRARDGFEAPPRLELRG